MLFSQTYYHLKPILPWRLRIALRRWRAKRRARIFADSWPIKHSAGHPPDGWPGWPEGKKFAVVLTHDVEGQKGLDRCRRLMALETRLGFRSSFNFIPEGEYANSRKLRDTLIENGFEVGVHDLKHDGKLYASRAAFREQAQEINRYLKEWNALGFRSGFMHHNLGWLHDLNVLYDASTFDTDPFEPQPDGVHTVFPFWVPGPNGSGYVELPYSMVQDFSLFIVLQEKSIDIWKKKLDWIASRGGMALVILHPDYVGFPDVHPARDEFPSFLYEEFLSYVKANYASLYWHALPREVAQHVYNHRQACLNPNLDLAGIEDSGRASPGLGDKTLIDLSSAPRIGQSDSSRPCDSRRQPSIVTNAQCLQGKRAAAATFSCYPSDPRPRRAAEALVKQGMTVDIICLRQNENDLMRENFNGVNILRIPLRRRRGGKIAYIFQYSFFILVSFTVLGFRSLTRRYSLVHVHNMPDVLVFSALVPKALGAKVVLDLHDPMPELMMTIFNLRRESLGVRVLNRLEKWSIGFSDMVLTVNLASKKIFASRSCSPEKIRVIMNSPDEQIFAFRQPASQPAFKRDPSEPFVVMYHGSLVERNGLDLAVDALEKVKATIPTAELRIYGHANSFIERVMDSVQKRGLQKAVHYLGARSLEQIVEAIDECDVGIIPNRRSVFTEMNTPTRIFEYLARGKPVIAPLAQGIQDYFTSEDLIFFDLGDASDLARKIEYVFFHPDKVKETVRRGQEICLTHGWNKERAILISQMRELVGAEN